jgi:hypothetical protein
MMIAPPERNVIMLLDKVVRKNACRCVEVILVLKELRALPKIIKKFVLVTHL